MNPEEILKRINQELEKLPGDGITRREFVDAFDHVMKMAVQAKEELAQLNQHELKQTKAEVLAAAQELTAKHHAALDDLARKADKVFKDQQSALNLIHDTARAVKKAPGKPGAPGKDGKDGAPGKPGKNGTELTPQEIRDKLLVALEEEGLDAAFIKNLPALPKNFPVAPMTGSLFQLGDVNVQGVTAGQSLKWDGVQWTTYTPSGASTAVYGENLTPQGPGTTFTLAHTPVAGSVRLFRGGARQSVANGDYSITGAVITLSPTLASGEVLVTDYAY